MEQFLWVSIAGGLGSGARYALASWVSQRAGSGFPWGTLTVNVLGCFALAFLTQAAGTTLGLSPLQKLALTTGFLGGFTTYSTFNQEALAAWQAGAQGQAALYVATTLAAGLAAGWCGLAAARALAVA